MSPKEVVVSILLMVTVIPLTLVPDLLTIGRKEELNKGLKILIKSFKTEDLPVDCNLTRARRNEINTMIDEVAKDREKTYGNNYFSNRTITKIKQHLSHDSKRPYIRCKVSTSPKKHNLLLTRPLEQEYTKSVFIRHAEDFGSISVKFRGTYMIFVNISMDKESVSHENDMKVSHQNDMKGAEQYLMIIDPEQIEDRVVYQGSGIFHLNNLWRVKVVLETPNTQMNNVEGHFVAFVV